jgi:hypothetical protein
MATEVLLGEAAGESAREATSTMEHADSRKASLCGSFFFCLLSCFVSSFSNKPGTVSSD